MIAFIPSIVKSDFKQKNISKKKFIFKDDLKRPSMTSEVILHKINKIKKIPLHNVSFHMNECAE